MESSAVVAALLEHDTVDMQAMSGHARIVTSALTLTETARAIVRARVSGRLTADQELAAVRALTRFSKRCFVLDVSHGVLNRAGRRFPVEPIRTLDAIHLATALLWQETTGNTVVMATHDLALADGAKAHGLTVVGS